MLAINHALTGTALALIIGDPYVALPAALLSHFVCDAIPHFTPNIPDDIWLKSKSFKLLLAADAILCIALVGVLALFHPLHWVLAAVCAFAATSPDLLWINRFVRLIRHKDWSPSKYSVFADKIQWFARPIGSVVEIAWFASGLIVVAQFL